jgi:hypothetical protein
MNFRLSEKRIHDSKNAIAGIVAVAALLPRQHAH